jgi:hypothetical protein
MAQLKGSNAHARFYRASSKTRAPRLAQSEDADRDRLIMECLRDLTGIELIYAIRCPSGTIKIGHTRDLMARRRHFDSTLEAILAITPGTYGEEQAIHAQLQASVAHGREYYHPTPEVLTFINGLREALGIQPLA